ncbi:hypothetical protein SPI_08080 [Niveomyces insectorum RCEF 264]|uniref:Uncharacterized protein n=1 Tax=Niveomyces insectorum RCEF 264 TaxID=1081102 RepID=A0A167NSI8_9HYPO|nr:hypothetical protein SPI_08080 [Niveomyces insectorum RCEF 264]
MVLNGSLERKTIYISLNTRPIAGEYHWGLVLTDSHGNPVLHHASNGRGGQWAYEERQVNPAQSLTLVALIRVAKVKSVSQAEEVIRSIPADGYPSQRTGEAFTCRIWVKDVLMALYEQGVISLPRDIDIIERTVINEGLTYAPYAEEGYGATVVDNAFSR